MFILQEGSCVLYGGSMGNTRSDEPTTKLILVDYSSDSSSNTDKSTPELMLVDYNTDSSVVSDTESLMDSNDSCVENLKLMEMEITIMVPPNHDPDDNDSVGDDKEQKGSSDDSGFKEDNDVDEMNTNKEEVGDVSTEEGEGFYEVSKIPENRYFAGLDDFEVKELIGYDLYYQQVLHSYLMYDNQKKKSDEQNGRDNASHANDNPKLY